MTNCTKNELEICDKFLNSDVEESDFKFEWLVAKTDNIDWDAVDEECNSRGLNIAFNRAKSSAKCVALATKIALVMKKHNKKHPKYQLFRHCVNNRGIVRAIAKMDKKDAEKAKKSANFAVLKAAVKNDSLKHPLPARDYFSSLSQMQAWLDKNNIAIDAYKAYGKWKRLGKEDK